MAAASSRHWQQSFDLFDDGSLRRLGRYFPEITVRLDLVGLCRLEQAVEVGAGIGAGHGVAEESVLAADDERPDRILGQIVVDSEPSVLDVNDELRPLLVGEVHRLAERRARRHDRQMLVEPAADVREQR